MTRDQAAKLAVSAYVKATIGMASQSEASFARAVASFQILWNDALRTMFGQAPFGPLTLDGRYGANSANALFWLLAASTGQSAAQGASWASSARTKSTLLSWAQRNSQVMAMGAEFSVYTQIATKMREGTTPVGDLVRFIESAIVNYTNANGRDPVAAATSSSTPTTASVSSQVPQVSVVSSEDMARNAVGVAADTRKLQDIEAEAGANVIANFTELNPIPISASRPSTSKIPTAVYVVGGATLLFGIGYAAIRVSKARS